MRAAGWALALALAGAPAASSAQPATRAPTTDEQLSALASASAALGSSDTQARTNALAVLGAVDGAALEAVRAHLRQLRARAANANGLRAKLALLQRLEGEPLPRRTEQLLAVLAREPGGASALAVELQVLLDALEAQHTTPAVGVMLHELLAVDPRALRGPVLRSVKRLGKLALLPLVNARASDEPALQKFAHGALVSLRLASVDAAFAHVPAPSRSELLASYAAAKPEEALPWALAYLDHADPALRETAARALERTSEVAPPLLIDYYAARTESEPLPSQTAPQLLRRLLDESTEEAEASAALDRAKRALSAGDLKTCERLLDELLRRPLDAGEALRSSALYLSLAAELEQRDQVGRALVAYRRALRLAPEAAHARTARARALYLEVERELARGVADLPRLGEAVALDPSFVPAAQLLDELSGARLGREQTQRKRIGFAAAAMLAFASLLLLRGRKIATPPAV